MRERSRPAPVYSADMITTTFLYGGLLPLATAAVVMLYLHRLRAGPRPLGLARLLPGSWLGYSA